MFQRVVWAFIGERERISKELSKLGIIISNLSEKLKQATDFCLNITSLWIQSGLNLREKLQKLIFPEGLFYDKNLQAFRTVRVNSVIAEIARLSSCLGEKEKGLPPFLWVQSLFAEKEGFEPPEAINLNGFQDRRYRPLCHFSGGKIMFFFDVEYNFFFYTFLATDFVCLCYKFWLNLIRIKRYNKHTNHEEIATSVFSRNDLDIIEPEGSNG